MERLKRIPLMGTYALLAYMPFHIFLSQWLSTFTGGLEAWKIGKDVFTALLTLVSVLLVIFLAKQKKLFYYCLAAAAGYFLLHLGVYYFNKDTSFDVAMLATAYNCRLLAYLLIGMSAVMLAPKQINIKKITKLVVIVSSIVAVLGVVQYALPKDTMTHFGYSIERGAKPDFSIDDKADLPRIMSTIRDPNSLGAFMIVPLLILWQGFLKAKKDRRMLFGGLLLLHGLALFLTFSRAAWAGAAIGLVVVTAVRYRQTATAWVKKHMLLVASVLLLLVLGGYLLRDQYVVQNVIFHNDESTTAPLNSDELHKEFISKGLEGAVEKPLGHGPGTAGVVSIQNPSGGLLTENYYLQILYEVGAMGLLLFALVWVFVTRRLDRSSAFSLALFGASIAYFFMALVMHLWVNEAVAAQWWLLAGLALLADKHKHLST